MEQVAFALRIDPARIEEYIDRHDRVDPELEAAFAEFGIKHYHIYHLGDGTLFAHMEVEDFEHAMRRLADHPANVKWQAFMADMLIAWEDGQMTKNARHAYSFNSQDEA